MSESDTISGSVKQRTIVEARTGRVGGTEHKKLVLLRRKQVIKKQNAKNRKIQC